MTKKVIELLHYFYMESPIGRLAVTVSGRGLLAIDWNEPKFSDEARWERSEKETATYIAELREYFAGARREFSVALDLRGTDFQKRCWKALLEIPFGKTCSYGDIAKAVGSPQGFRAVGMANHANPIPIVVPCHRVINSSGGLHGYGGGLDIKRKLLQLEGAISLDFSAEPAKKTAAIKAAAAS